MTVQQEALQSAGACTSMHPKLSGQRAYLQSLDRSSRAWVLSSAKSQASDEVCGAQDESGSNIWYNPIPEEEDSGPCREDVIWRRRDDAEEEEVTRMAETGKSRVGLVGHSGPRLSGYTDDIRAENIICFACSTV